MSPWGSRPNFCTPTGEILGRSKFESHRHALCTPFRVQSSAPHAIPGHSACPIACVLRVERVLKACIQPPACETAARADSGPIPFARFLAQINREDWFERSCPAPSFSVQNEPRPSRASSSPPRRDATLARIGEVPLLDPPAAPPRLERLLLVEKISATGRLIDVVI